MPVFRKSFLIVWAAALVLLIGSQAVLADGKMVIKPYVDMSLRSESNYWELDTNERSVMTYSLSPGVDFGYTTAKSEVILGYTLGAHWFADLDSTPVGGVKASNLDYIGHDFNLAAQTKPTDKLTLGVGDTYIYTRDPASSSEYNNLTSREKYSINQFTPWVGYDFDGKFGARAEYNNECIDYSTAGEEDSTKNGGTFIANYNLNQTSSIALEYKIWERDYDGLTSDFTSNRIMGIYSQELNYFTVSAGLGYHDRSFDQAGIEDMDAFAWKIAVSGQNPPRQMAGQEVKSHMKVALSQDLNDLGYGQNYYTATRLDVEAGRLFLEKLDATLAGYYQQSDYEDDPANRDDETFQISGRLKYLYSDRFSAGLVAGYETRDSNLAGFDYDNTFIQLNLRMNLDFASR